MNNVTQITPANPPALQTVSHGDGVAIMRGGYVQAVITRDELAQHCLDCARAMQGKL